MQRRRNHKIINESNHKATYRCGMKEEVSRLPEDEGELLVVVGHHLGREYLDRGQEYRARARI